jgi:hypothetical protein
LFVPPSNLDDIDHLGIKQARKPSARHQEDTMAEAYMADGYRVFGAELSLGQGPLLFSL